EPPSEALVPSEFGTIQVGYPPGSGVDLDLHSLDRSTPGGSHDGVTVLTARDFDGGRLETVVPDRVERPDCLALALLFADADVAAGHVITREALVHYLNAGQPLHIGDSVPAGRDQPYREAVLGRQRLAVHSVA